jgi:glycosyltransferase involved in cell wall biosynthesis
MRVLQSTPVLNSTSAVTGEDAYRLRAEQTAGIRVALCAPGESWGGVEQFVDSLSRYFRTTGVPVLVILFFDGPLRAKLEASGTPVHVMRSRYGDPRIVFEFARILRQHQIDVVHAHGYKATILGAAAARLSGARLVRTEHGLLEPEHRGWVRLKMRFNSRLEKVVSRLAADAVVFVSNDVQTSAKSAGPHTLQKVVYNGFEPLPPSTDLSLEGFDSDRRLFNVGIIGRLVGVKGHAHLLEAMERLRGLDNLRLYVFGDGPLETHYRSQVEQAGLTGVVRFMGFRPNVQDYLRRLDLLVMPSLHEGLPFTLLEAMYHRIPIVASRVGGLAEVIRDDVDGVLVRPGDPAELADAIERLYRDANRRKQISDNAYQTVVSKFLIDSMADQYLAVYRQAMAG